MEISTTSKATTAQISILTQSFAWMFVGLLFTAVTSFLVANNETLTSFFVSNSLVFFVLIFAEFALVAYLTFRIQKMSFVQALGAFFIYSILNGLTLSSLVLIYTSTSVATAFLGSAAIFGIMAAIGYTTKRDLTTLGNLALVALIGIIIASIINFFLKSSTFSYFLSYLIILVFLALTARDTQKLKQLSATQTNPNIGVMGALMLYLDFINIFINLLRIFGRQK